MLNVKRQYQLAQGVLISMKDGKPFVQIKGESQIFSTLFSGGRFETFSESKFVLFSVYVIYTYSIKTINDFISVVKNKEDIKADFEKFIEELKHWKMFAQKELENIRKNNTTPEELIILLKQHQIKFYTFYFYFLLTGNWEIFEKRMYKGVLKELRAMATYFPFKLTEIEKFKKYLIDLK